MTTKRKEDQKARSDEKSGVPFSWPAIVEGAVDPLRMGTVQWNRPDSYMARARELAVAAGLDPEARTGEGRGKPVWTTFRQAARDEHVAKEQAAFGPKPNPNHPTLEIFGEHDAATITQMRNCMSVGNAVAGVICADGHLGYAQPVGGVIAYEKQISISGVGFDIGCGNMAVKLDTKFHETPNSLTLVQDIARSISFGIGRTNAARAEHALFDDSEAWRAADMEAYRTKAEGQLGTVGGGNHYVDLMRDVETDHVWIGVHFGSRGLGHTSATRYLKAAGGTDGMNVPPAVVDEDSELGQRYIAAMELAGRYSYAGREWVVERVRKIIGGNIVDMVHNHHNYAWRETHGGRDLWVVRKGATPAFPGQRGFVGGSMGDDAVIIEGVDSPEAKAALYSTIHGAGRLFGRKEAKRRFDRAEMDSWLRERGVTLIGADLDESPMAYRRLPEVLAHHAGSIKVLHTLRLSLSSWQAKENLTHGRIRQVVIAVKRDEFGYSVRKREALAEQSADKIAAMPKWQKQLRGPQGAVARKRTVYLPYVQKPLCCE